MFGVSKETLERLRKDYPVGCRVELTKMNDPFRTDLVPGCKGTVKFVDDAGSIHIRWDIGSSLAVVFGEDACRKLDSVTVICYGESKVWDSRAEAIKFYLEGMTACEGAEHDRYTNIYLALLEGCDVCKDRCDDDEW